MSRPIPIISLFLVGENKFENNEAYYVIAYYDRSTPEHASVPHLVSHNVFCNRKAIIEEISLLQQDIYNNTTNSKCMSLPGGVLQNFKVYVGNAIRNNLNMLPLYDMLWKNKEKTGQKEVCIVTNDFEIPWEWAWDKSRDEFFCESFVYGKLFVEYIHDYLRFLYSDHRDARAMTDESELTTEVQNSSAIILCDDWRDHPERHLECVKSEVEAITATLQDKLFKKKNIHFIDGKQPEAEPDFLRCLTMEARNLKLIHFSGHIDRRGLLLSNGVIEPDELSSLASPTESKLLQGSPLVFLNGCFSGHIKNIWQQHANLSTAFAQLGAAATVCSYFPLRDDLSRFFATQLYKYLIALDCPVGEALNRARRDLKEHLNRPEEAEELQWLFYTLYGDPSISLFPTKSIKDLGQELTMRANMVDDDSLLRELLNMEDNGRNGRSKE